MIAQPFLSGLTRLSEPAPCVQRMVQHRALARSGEVLVSTTVRDLVAGSGLQFEERGVHTLKGVLGRSMPWRAADGFDVCFWPKADIPSCTAHVRYRG